MRQTLIERKYRKKILNFRLSGEELEQVIDSASRSGARSLSEYIRDAVLFSARSDLRREMTGVDGVPVQGSQHDAEPIFRLQRVLASLEEALRSTRQELGEDPGSRATRSKREV